MALSSYAQSSYPYVDPFIGCEASNLPEVEGIAKNWWKPKAQVGNTHPGACYPFGMVSVCPYSGGYPTGYGLYETSTSGLPSPVFDDYKASGFTHFQQSGTGAIGTYYNFLRITPFCGKIEDTFSLQPISEEQARPGYYSCVFGEDKIYSELSCGETSVMHRYTFPHPGQTSIAIDLSAGGLAGKWQNERPTVAHARVSGNDTVTGYIVANGLRLYFTIILSHAPERWHAFYDENVREDIVEAGYTEDYGGKCGLIAEFSGACAGPIEMEVAFSAVSAQKAKENLASVSFDDMLENTQTVWVERLGRIRVSGGGMQKKRIFYTALYHSLIKPADFSRDFARPFVFDVATLWDVYKTQMPLVMYVYPETATNVTSALLGMSEKHGYFPNAYLMHKDMTEEGFNEQAKALAHTVLMSAYYAKVPNIDWSRALQLMARSCEDGLCVEFAKNGCDKRPTHTLDCAFAAYITSQLAHRLGEEELAVNLDKLSQNWTRVISPETGRLPDGDYYEGGSWTYSFRLVSDMEKRVELAGGKEIFASDLDEFFGYTDSADENSHETWEALNNQADMEAPYSYIFADRHDRLCEVVRSCMRYRFADGRGGLPGNDDSGGTSAWYAWNAVGLFPFAGTDKIFIGSPIFDRIDIGVAGGTFSIVAKNNSETNIYVRKATLNGTALDRWHITAEEFTSGGTLVLEMGD